MTIQLKSRPTDKIIELGGGARPLVRPNVDVRSCVDAQGRPTVDIVASFEAPLPLETEEYDGVFSQYVLEHITWRNTQKFVKEIYRILKPGGKAVIITANTEAQINWIRDHPTGWDDQPAFESFSCVLFGDSDYPENSHKAYFDPRLLHHLFHEAGFEKIEIQPYGARDTDLVLQAIRPIGIPAATTERAEKPDPNVAGKRLEGAVAPSTSPFQKELAPVAQKPEEQQPFQAEGRGGVLGEVQAQDTTATHPVLSREELFDKLYFNGGGKVGGYAREGYRDFPAHEITFRHIMIRRPESVLEAGCARGYVLKRLQDAGVRVAGLEISRHCFLTRALEDVFQHDLCNFPWPIPDQSFDLFFNIATLEHIPEQSLPGFFAEIKRTCKRGLHGIDFGEKDDGFDRTHCTLKSPNWWRDQFTKHGLSPKDHEILNKEELEQGKFPEEVLKGDGKVKLNIGSHTTMFHHGWINVDMHDLMGPFAQPQGYHYQRLDVRNGLPYPTSSVHLLFLCHFLEHLTYSEGLSFLKECRRVIHPEGAMRILVPDTGMLTRLYNREQCGIPSLDYFNEINDECASSPTSAGRLWSLLFAGHQAAYDHETLRHHLGQAGWVPKAAHFRKTDVPAVQQILRECVDMQPAISLFMDATPLLG